MSRSSRIKVEKEISGYAGHIQLEYRIYPPKPDISIPRLDMSFREF
jgi:hypothetical protein